MKIYQKDTMINRALFLIISTCFTLALYAMEPITLEVPQARDEETSQVLLMVRQDQERCRNLLEPIETLLRSELSQGQAACLQTTKDHLTPISNVLEENTDNHLKLVKLQKEIIREFGEQDSLHSEITDQINITKQNIAETHEVLLLNFSLPQVISTILLIARHTQQNTSQLFRELTGKEYTAKEYNEALVKVVMVEDSCDVEIVLMLLRLGASATEEVEGIIPLHYAALYGSVEIYKLLVDNGADINARTVDSEKTPLHCAAQMGHVETCRLLIKLGADINAKDKKDNPPLEYAVSGKHEQICQLLIEGKADCNVKDKDDITILLHAALKGLTDTCELLIKHGARINYPSKYISPLYHAIKQNHPEVCALLTYHGANFITDGSFIFAAKEGNIGALKAIVSNALFLPQPTTKQNSSEVITALLTSLKKKAPYLTYDMYFTILEKEPELRDHLIKRLIPYFIAGKPISNKLHNLIIEEVTYCTLARLRPLLLKAQAVALNEETKVFLDPDLAEKRFGNELRKSIRSRLTSGEKVQANDELIEESLLSQYRNHIFIGTGIALSIGALTWATKKLKGNKPSQHKAKNDYHLTDDTVGKKPSR